jgi:hypothetical protein
VGKGFKAPFMIEWKWGYDYQNAEGGVGQAVAPWMASVEWVDKVAAGTPNQLGSVNGGEIDVTDYGSTSTAVGPANGGGTFESLLGQYGILGSNVSNSFGTGYNWFGYPDFAPKFILGGNSYIGNDVVFSGGTYYWSMTNGTNTAPPSAQWGTYVYPSGAGNSFSRGPPFRIDFSQLIPFMQIVLPYDQATGDYGCWLCWVNNAFTNGVAWTPASTADNCRRIWNTIDQQHWFLMIAAQVGYAGVQTQYDYVRISQ